MFGTKREIQNYENMETKTDIVIHNNTGKNYLFSKFLIIFLSLILGLSGLGLVFAGVRTAKKSWLFSGVIYIAIEMPLILFFDDIGAKIIIMLAYFISTIHTVLICGEYGRLLYAKKITKNNGYLNSNISVEQQPVVTTSTETKSEKNSESSKDIFYEKIKIDIGTATVKGKSVDKLLIRIQNNNGVFEFNTVDTDIESIEVNGKIYSYGG